MEIIHEICTPLRKRDTPLNDCLLIYFAGHGLIGAGDDGHLLLAVRNTHEEYAEDSALSAASLKRLMSNCKVGFSILMLDCCYAGKAGQEPFPDHTLRMLGHVARYVICSSGPRQLSRTPKNSPYTGFAGALLEAMKNGLPNHQGATLSFRALMQRTAELCNDKGLPAPWLNYMGQAEAGIDFQFIRNMGFRAEPAIEQIEKTLLPLIENQDDRARLLQATKEDRERHENAAAARQVNKMLYDLIHKDRGEVHSAVATAAKSLQAFRDFFDTSKHTPSWTLNSSRTVMTISENGDTILDWARQVTTGKPLWYIWAFMTGDEAFEGFDPLQCQFDVSYVDSEGTQQVTVVVPLRLVDKPKRKEFVLYVYPEIPAQSEVEVRVKYRWPKLFRALVEGGQDYWAFNVESGIDIATEVITVFEMPESAGELTVTNETHLSAERAVEKEHGRNRVTYSIPRVVNGTHVKLNLSLVRPPEIATHSA